MQTESYKSRAKNVRQSARSHLAELRRARLAKKPPSMQSTVPAISEADVALPDDPGPQTDVNDVSEATTIVPGLDELDEIALRNAAMAEMGEPTEPPANPTEPVVGGTDETEDHGKTASEVDQQPLTAEAGEAIEEDGEPTSSNPDTGGPEPDRSTLEIGSEEPDWRTSSLSTLPGAGPGLVWMLGKCDVHTLSDLAQQDETDLSEKLGVVGQILDVGHWIKVARDA